MKPKGKTRKSNVMSRNAFSPEAASRLPRLSKQTSEKQNLSAHKKKRLFSPEAIISKLQSFENPIRIGRKRQRSKQMNQKAIFAVKSK